MKVGKKTLKSLKRHPSTHTSCWRRAEHVLQTSTTFCLSRRLQEVFARGLLEDVLKKTSSKHILQTSERHLGRWKIVPLNTASRRLQNVLENKNVCRDTVLRQEVFRNLLNIYEKKRKLLQQNQCNEGILTKSLQPTHCKVKPVFLIFNSVGTPKIYAWAINTIIAVFWSVFGILPLVITHVCCIR